jgi:hypothetical protein
VCENPGKSSSTLPIVYFKIFDHYCTSSAALQNNIRQRVVLVVALTLGIQAGRPFVSDSVHKANPKTNIFWIGPMETFEFIQRKQELRNGRDD